MNICVKFAKRNSRLSSIENKDLVAEGETFQSAYSEDTNRFDIYNITCTAALFEELSPLVGTRETAYKLANATAEQRAGILNVYVENGSLKKAS